MKKKQQETAFLIVFMAVLLYIAANSTTLGLPSSLGDDLISLFPGLLLSFISLKGYSDGRGPTKSLALFFFSIGLALLVGSANDLTLVTDDMLTGLTIAQLQTWIIVFGGIFTGVDYYRR